MMMSHLLVTCIAILSMASEAKWSSMLFYFIPLLSLGTAWTKSPGPDPVVDTLLDASDLGQGAHFMMLAFVGAC